MFGLFVLGRLSRRGIVPWDRGRPLWLFVRYLGVCLRWWTWNRRISG